MVKKRKGKRGQKSEDDVKEASLNEIALLNILDHKAEEVPSLEDTKRNVSIMDMESLRNALPDVDINTSLFDRTIESPDVYKEQFSLSIPVDVDLNKLGPGNNVMYMVDCLRDRGLIQKLLNNNKDYDFSRILIQGASLTKSNLQSGNVFIGSSVQKTIIDHVNSVSLINSERNQFQYQYSDGEYSSGEDESMVMDKDEKEDEGISVSENYPYITYLSSNEAHTEDVFRKKVYYTEDEWIENFGGLTKEMLINGVVYGENGECYIPERLGIAYFYKANAKNLNSRPFIHFTMLGDKHKVFKMSNTLLQEIQEEMYQKMLSMIPYEDLKSIEFYFMVDGGKEEEVMSECNKLSFELNIQFCAWPLRMPTSVSCLYDKGIYSYYHDFYKQIEESDKVYAIKPEVWHKEIAELRKKERDEQTLLRPVGASTKTTQQRHKKSKTNPPRTNN